MALQWITFIIGIARYVIHEDGKHTGHPMVRILSTEYHKRFIRK
jgi:hypothetical protein